MMQYLYGLHDPGGERLMAETPGWVVVTESLGHDANNRSGRDYRSLLPHNVIVRLNHGYFPDGTVPGPDHLLTFAQRCQNFVLASAGCTRWIIGNEPNHTQERPYDMIITPQYYATAFNICQDRLKSVLPDDQVILAAIAPWNVQTGDWLLYFQTILDLTSPDAITLHTYTHGSDPTLVFSKEKMVTHLDRYYHFRAYRDFLAAVPERWRDLPVYITETDQDDPWADVNSGWVQNAYAEIDGWNKSVGQKVSCLCLYRWQKADKWHIEGKPSVQADFTEAAMKRYESPGKGEIPDVALVTNPGFENGFREVDGDGRKTVGEQWWPGWNDDYGPQPEFKPEQVGVGQGHVRSGQYAQKYFTTFSQHEAWLSQHVDGCEPGELYRLTAHVWVWSSGTNEDGSQSSPPTGKVWVRVGINPWGDANAMTPSTEFGGALVDQYDQWLELEVIVRAKRPTMAIFLWSQAEHGVKHNDLYWDDVLLEKLDCSGETPPPVEPPGDCDCPSLDEIRQVVRQELDRTVLSSDSRSISHE